MTEQQYRVIADRDKGDDPQVSDLNQGDRVTSIIMNDDPACDHIVRIERPVPTTDEAVGVECPRCKGYGVDPSVQRAGDMVIDCHRCGGTGELDPSPDAPSVPTREQIASITYQHVTHTTIWGGSGKHGWKCSCGVHDWGTSVENPERYREHDTREAARLGAAEHVADAVLALIQKGTDR